MRSSKKICECTKLPAVFGLALALVLAVSVTAWGQPGQGQCCYTAPGQFRFPTSGHIDAVVGGQPVALDLLGPTMVMTKPPNPNIPTEMLALELSGASPMGGGASGHLIPGTSSTGQASGTNSFFDVFFEISLDQAPWAGGRPDTLYVGQPGNQYIPVHVTSSNLNCIPPQPGATWTGPGTPLPLTSRTLHAIIGQLNLVVHTVLAPNHYKTWRIDDFSPAQIRPIVAKDQFGVSNLLLDSAVYLSNPVQKCISGTCFNVADTTDHFTWYQASGPPVSLQVDYQNQFGTGTFLIDSVEYFLTPTQKFPHNAPKLLDHYKAYRIKNPQPFTGLVQLTDQFDLADPRGAENINVLTPRYFLAPAQKNTEPVYDTLTHYVAYEINPKRPTTMSRDIQDQFGVHSIRVDSSVFVLVPTCKLRFKPQGCTPGIPDCDSVTTDRCLLICPKSDVVFTVTVKDSCGNPICDPNLWLDFSQCHARPCVGEEPTWPIVHPDSCRNGVHYFTIDASMIDCTVCQASLFVGGKFCRLILAHFLDTNGDFCVTATDFVGGPCNDYNCDGVVDAADQAIFQAHLGHCCPNIGAVGPNCDSTIVPNCLVMCPASDVPYTIVLKDANGNPVGGYPVAQMWLDFSGCPLVCPCPEEKSWPRVFPNGPSNALGQVTFYVDAGIQCPPGQPCPVVLNIVLPNGTVCSKPIDRVLSTDINCNHVVEQSDFISTGSSCNDYNCDGIVDAVDYGFWLKHLGHHCGPCDQFREEIRIKGCDPDKVNPGDICQVCLSIHNNLPDTCCLDSLIWQYANFNATGVSWNTFCKQNYGGPVGRPCIAPGDSAEFCCNFVVPDNQHHCVRVLKFSSCCNDTVQRNLLNDHDPFNCGRRCDTFRVPIQVPAGAVFCVVPVESLPPGWSATYSPALTTSPPTCFPAPGPGVITVVICTDNNPLKGQVGCVTLVVTDASGKVFGKATVCKRIACKLGDSNNDDALSPADVVNTLNWVFLGVLPAGPTECLDINGDGAPSPADVVNELNLVFLGMYPAGMPCAP